MRGYGVSVCVCGGGGRVLEVIRSGNELEAIIAMLY